MHLCLRLQRVQGRRDASSIAAEVIQWTQHTHTMIVGAKLWTQNILNTFPMILEYFSENIVTKLEHRLIIDLSFLVPKKHEGMLQKVCLPEAIHSFQCLPVTVSWIVNLSLSCSNLTIVYYFGCKGILVEISWGGTVTFLDAPFSAKALL